MENNLDTQVRALLESRRGEWPAIAEGSNVSYSWLSKFANGHIPNPGLVTLRELYQFLAAKKVA